MNLARRLKRLARFHDLLQNEAFAIVIRGQEIKKSKAIVTVRDYVVEVEKLRIRHERLERKYHHYRELYRAVRYPKLDGMYNP